MAQTQIAENQSIQLPTLFGDFMMKAYDPEVLGEQPTVVIFKGDLQGREDVLVRFHSECLTGDIFGSLRCDCWQQLQETLKMIHEEGSGAVIYLRQEGRGIDLVNKLKTYILQEQGYDTVEANVALDLPVDAREDSACLRVLNDLGVRSIRLVTNNPDKIEKARELGIEVTDRVEIEAGVCDANERYLQTKKEKMGHFLKKNQQEGFLI
ncbi:GTP cyclohydrolase II [Tumebacillus permanentifrigoris]|uniref:GTP cyclohydrolase-2 n=1 Tax=Tumebacillus permanentifrigoris TaxID=378543 RepID=A0A316D502_9BACL|nr:GTP cyclohydrolase II [Tumebacillus permanentifrigoris]PWK07893.1 GTP cyclohydrolase II [Tumebacillus permanentifrigoris]